MSRYTSGWTWRDDAEPEQIDNPINEGACKRLYAEIVRTYEGISDPSDERDGERRDMALECAYEDAGGGDAGEEACRKLKERWAKERADAFGALEALEDLLAHRGARLKEEYEDWNEDAQRVRLAESRNDYDYPPDY